MIAAPVSPEQEAAYEALARATSNAGGTTSTVALAGFATGDLASGRLTTSFSNGPSGNPYLLIHAKS